MCYPQCLTCYHFADHGSFFHHLIYYYRFLIASILVASTTLEGWYFHSLDQRTTTCLPPMVSKYVFTRRPIFRLEWIGMIFRFYLHHHIAVKSSKGEGGELFLRLSMHFLYKDRPSRWLKLLLMISPKTWISDGCGPDFWQPEHQTCQSWIRFEPTTFGSIPPTLSLLSDSDHDC